MGNIKGEPCVFHDSASIGGLGLTLGGKGHVVPASEEVELVPRTLAVAKENKISKHDAIVGEAGFAGYFDLPQNLESGRIKFSVTKVATVAAEAYSDHIYPRQPWQR